MNPGCPCATCIIEASGLEKENAALKARITDLETMYLKIRERMIAARKGRDALSAESQRLRLALEAIEKHIQIVAGEGMTPRSTIYSIARKALEGREK